MIKINGVEILTVLDDMMWNGSKDSMTRNLNFSFLYNPLVKDIPKYAAAVGDRVEWIEGNKTLFLGYIETLPYNTDDDSVSVTCCDLASRLKSKCIGRFKGTLNQLFNKICGLFSLQNGVNSNSGQVHNIVSTGDLSYFDVLQIACKTVYPNFTLYIDGNTLKVREPLGQKEEPIETFEIGKNIRSSSFSQSMSSMVTRVIILDNNGNILGAVEDSENLSKYGLFQEIYNYNKDIKNNVAEAQKMLKGVENDGSIVVNNKNNCISGQYIRIKEPVNGFKGIFEILTDSHTIGVDSVMTLEVKYVRGG